jgi:hypothetical protein
MGLVIIEQKEREFIRSDAELFELGLGVSHRKYKRLGETIFWHSDEENVVCVICQDWTEFLCDYPIGNGKTCDHPLCLDCRHHIGDGQDLCPVHFKMFNKEESDG